MNLHDIRRGLVHWLAVSPATAPDPRSDVVGHDSSRTLTGSIQAGFSPASGHRGSRQSWQGQGGTSGDRRESNLGPPPIDRRGSACSTTAAASRLTSHSLAVILAHHPVITAPGPSRSHKRLAAFITKSPDRGRLAILASWCYDVGSAPAWDPKGSCGTT